MIAAVNSEKQEEPISVSEIDYALSWPSIAFTSLNPDHRAISRLLSANTPLLIIENLVSTGLESAEGPEFYPVEKLHTHILVENGSKNLLDSEPKVVEEVVRFLKGETTFSHTIFIH